MALPFTLSVAAAAILLTRFLLYPLLIKLRNAQKSRTLGCGEVPPLPSGLLFGLSNLREVLQADREKLVPALFEKRFQTVSEQEGRSVLTFKARQVGREFITTADPRNIQALLATQFRDFGLGFTRWMSLHPLLGTGIFTSDGETWAHSRALLRPQFNRGQISDLDLEERHVQAMMQALPTISEDGWTAKEVNIQTLFFRLTIDTATEFLFGESVHSQMAALKDSGYDADNFSYYWDKAQWYLSQRARLDSLRFLVNNNEFRECLRRVHGFVDHFVQLAIDTVQKGEKHDVDIEKSSSSPPHYVFLRALAETTQDPLELRWQLVNILLAGRDTTASLLSWSILLLTRHPAVLTKLRESILADFGPYPSRDSITFSSLKSCSYLQHFLNETLRLFPIVPVNRRTALRDTTLPTGGGKDGTAPIFVPKGGPVAYNTHVLHRSKDIWGPDADQFIPERWVGRRVTWEHIPFNAGPRICIGQQFALTEAGYVLVRLLQRFDRFEDAFPDRPVRWGLTLTSCPADPVTVRLHEARTGTA